MPKGKHLTSDEREARIALIDECLNKGICRNSTIADTLVNRSEFAGTSHRAIVEYISRRKGERGITIKKERILAIRQAIDASDMSMESIAKRVKGLSCFEGLTEGSVLTYLYRYSDDIDMPKNRCPSGPRPAGDKAARKPTTVIPKVADTTPVTLNDVLNYYTKQLSYLASASFIRFVECYLRPFVRGLEEQSTLATQLKKRISELEEEIIELREHKCPDAGADARYTINELREQVIDLTNKISHQNQRSQLLAEDNQKLRSRSLNPEKHSVIHARSVRLGSDG